MTKNLIRVVLGNDNAVKGISYSQEEDQDKALEGSSGAAGGYLVPEDVEIDKGTEPLFEKQPPPPPKRGGQDQASRDQPAADEQEQHQQPPPQQQADPDAAKDPKAVLNRLVDALAAYLEITQPAAAPEDEEDDEDEEEEDDMPDQQVEDDEVGDERYQFRAATPAKVKRGKYTSRKLVKRCKDVMTSAAGHLEEVAGTEKLMGSHRDASRYHHKELMGCVKEIDEDSGEDDDEQIPAAPPEQTIVTKKEEPEDNLLIDFGHIASNDDDLDLDKIMRELTPVKGRMVAVGNAWDVLQGQMP